MTMLANTTEFLSHLQQSKLLSDEQFERALELLAELGESDAMAAAKALVKAGFITRLHAQRLLEGRTHGFFIGDYRIEDILGSGGMGWVYIARDLRTTEEVALKMLCDQNESDAGLLTRFRLEAEAGLRLKHHAIIRAREIGQTVGVYGNVHFLVMDLIRGVGVDELVAISGPIDWPLTCHIARHVAAGLHHAHRMGLVHRDIKPANVLVDHLSNAHVLDFGLSVASRSEFADEFSLSMIFGQDCLGTADYIAPEQARDSFHVDRRADIYSLGAMMYFMLAGQVMFPERKTRSENINAQFNEQPRPIRELVPAIPDEVAQILHRMLAKDREQRIATAREVVELLAPFAKPKPVTFDFQHVLNRRFVIARQRQKMLDDRAQRFAKATSLSVCSVDSKTTRPTQAQSETAIHKDTYLLPDQPKE